MARAAPPKRVRRGVLELILTEGWLLLHKLAGQLVQKARTKMPCCVTSQAPPKRGPASAPAVSSHRFQTRLQLYIILYYIILCYIIFGPARFLVPVPSPARARHARRHISVPAAAASPPLHSVPLPLPRSLLSLSLSLSRSFAPSLPHPPSSLTSQRRPAADPSTATV